MKKIMTLIAVAAIFNMVSCTPSENPTPGGEVQKEYAKLDVTFNPTTLSFAKDETAVKDLEIVTEAAWTLTSDAWISVSASSGEGNATVKVSVSPNEGEDRTGSIRLKVSNEIATKEYSFQVTQEGVPQVTKTVIAVWGPYTAEEPVKSDNWTEPADGSASSFAVGFNDKWCPSLKGSGKLSFYNACDKLELNSKRATPLNLSAKFVRSVAAKGCPYTIHIWEGDYWLYEIDATAKAGAVLSFSYSTLVSNVSNVPAYWRVEYLDGSEWVPMDEMQTSGDLKYHFLIEGKAKENNFAPVTYTLKKDTEKISIKVIAAGTKTNDGTVLVELNNGNNQIKLVEVALMQ